MKKRKIMYSKKTVVYPGSFDPITMGHLNIIERASVVFGNVVVGVLINPEKRGYFDLDERIRLINKSISHLSNVEVRTFDGLLVDFLKEVNSRVIIKGLRVVSDFDYELQMANANRQLDNSVETLLMMTNPEYSFLSSSTVRQIMHFGGNVKGFVPDIILEDLELKMKELQALWRMIGELKINQIVAHFVFEYC